MTIEPAQGDRERAADWFALTNSLGIDHTGKAFEEALRDGSYDDDRHPLVQAFAAHRIAAETATAARIAERKRFPVLGAGASVDWHFVADHGKQARANHYQSVEQLAQRGGLSWCELHAVVHNHKWRRMDDNEAMLGVRALEARYLAFVDAETATAARIAEENRGTTYSATYQDGLVEGAQRVAAWLREEADSYQSPLFADTLRRAADTIVSDPRAIVERR